MIKRTIKRKRKPREGTLAGRARWNAIRARRLLDEAKALLTEGRGFLRRSHGLTQAGAEYFTMAMEFLKMTRENVKAIEAQANKWRRRLQRETKKEAKAGD